LNIDDREKTFFFFSFLSFVFRRNLDETPISSAGRLCNSFCKGIKILGWQSVSTFESPSAFYLIVWPGTQMEVGNCRLPSE
jgi:hypothetical protein